MPPFEFELGRDDDPCRLGDQVVDLIRGEGRVGRETAVWEVGGAGSAIESGGKSAAVEEFADAASAAIVATGELGHREVLVDVFPVHLVDGFVGDGDSDARRRDDHGVAFLSCSRASPMSDQKIVVVSGPTTPIGLAWG